MAREIARLVYDTYKLCYADSETGSIFDPDKHKKYEAEYYYQAKTFDKMVDPERREISQKAYDDYVDSLRMIQQLEPLLPEHTGQKVPVPSDADAAEFKEKRKESVQRAQHERLLSDRRAAPLTFRFVQRLKKRVRKFNEEQISEAGRKIKDVTHLPSEVAAPAKSAVELALQGTLKAEMHEEGLGPGLRDATMKFLTAPADPDYTLGGLATHIVMIIIMINALYQQIVGIYQTEQGPWLEKWLGFVTLSQRQALLLIWMAKEAFIISVPLFYLLAWTLVSALGLLFSPLVAYHYFAHVEHNKLAKRKFQRGVSRDLLPAVSNLIGQVATLILQLSTTWRILNKVQQLIRKKTNRSAKDWMQTLTTMSNMMYGLGLLILIHDNQQDPTSMGLSLLSSLGMLMHALVTQSMQVEEICDCLKDINEHRLSKFEFALFVHKLQETMLDDDIQYNFVEHFYTGADVPLTPDVGELSVETREDVGEFVPEIPKALAEKFGADDDNSLLSTLKQKDE
mmetsp:Transcript_22202/g.52558  ORF Transcript_22202/g.52558 Transcript_22202/m.52558 type:complete len:511 (+) Transcript_22202:48-1580(+)